MKHLKKFNEVIDLKTLSPDELLDAIIFRDIGREKTYDLYTKNSDGTIDVDGSIKLFNYPFINIPFIFNNVSGSFDCSRCLLISLKGSPTKTEGSFNCSKNLLTSLEGIGDVEGDLQCGGNKLTNFYGIGKVGGYIHCVGNPVDEIFYLCGTTEFVKYLNEFRPIRGKTILGKRLQECLYMCDVELDVTTLKFKNYELLE